MASRVAGKYTVATGGNSPVGMSGSGPVSDVTTVANITGTFSDSTGKYSASSVVSAVSGAGAYLIATASDFTKWRWRITSASNPSGQSLTLAVVFDDDPTNWNTFDNSQPIGLGESLIVGKSTALSTGCAGFQPDPQALGISPGLVSAVASVNDFKPCATSDTTIVSQTAHGFGSIFTGTKIPIPITQSTVAASGKVAFAVASTNDANSLHDAFLVDIIDANSFVIRHTGYVTTNGAHGLTKGSYYYSKDTGGSSAVTGYNLATTPDANFDDPVFYVVDETRICLLDNRPISL